MANVNAPFGLSPSHYRNGAKYNGAGNVYSIRAATTNALYVGDPVAVEANADTNGIQSVVLATAGSTWRGVIVAIGTNPFGPWVNPNDLSKNYRPSGAQSVPYYALVADDPGIVFEIQEIGTGTTLTATSVGRNVNFVNASPATGVLVSGATLDNTTVNTTSTLNLKILGAVLRPDNTPFAQYQKWWVMMNNTDFAAGTTSL